jgi:phospholipid/cholesterol/gamma-HCH transport system substrate-binding protein
MKRANETLVGAAVLGALAIMVAGSIWLSQARLGRNDQIAEARFRNIGGLQTGNPIFVHGVRIGRVEAILLGERNWVNVRFRIKGDAHLPPHPAAIISSTTLFGDWGVDVVPQEELPDDPEVRKEVADALAAGRERWPGASLPAIGELTAQAGRIAGDIATIAGRVEAAFDTTSARRLQGAFVDLSNLSRRMSQIVLHQQEALTTIGANLDTGTASLARGAASLERTLRRADSATSHEQLQRILSHTDSVTTDLQQVAANLRAVSGAAAAQSQSIGRILRNTDSILGRVEAGEGTLGRLTRDSTLYTESVQAVRSLREMLQDMQRNPRRYFSFSVF